MIEVVRRGYITDMNQAPNDKFLVVILMDIQLFERDGWKEGDEIKATIQIEKIER